VPDKKTTRNYIRYLPVYGCISTGLIYTGIGVIAILSFLKIKHGGADEGSMLAYLNHYLLGKFIVWIILTGTLCYIVWRIYEAFKDPYEYGNGSKGAALRTGIGLSSVADIFIAFSAIQVILGKGNIREDGVPIGQRQLVGDLMQQEWGEWLVVIIGFVVLITALVQFLYGFSRGYDERLDIAHFSKMKKNIIHVFAWAGYTARGIILAITGFFLIKAGLTDNSQVVVNTDKAFDFIGDHVGHVYFILVAIGTILYGFFMFTLGITYNADKD
jgi:hypothetical protein